MADVFVIPDVHLKPRMFEQAEKLVSAGGYDAIVMLGDLVDDWEMQLNIDLYDETFDAAVAFAERHPNTCWCYGNHDVSYLWQALESGYSYLARETVVNRIRDLRNALSPEKCVYLHRIDQVIFSHAGLTESFVSRHFGDRVPEIDPMIAAINRMGETELWEDDSPIWARPQYGEMRLFSEEYLQVVGHTPVQEALQEGNLLTLDTFSTYSNGAPIGNERFVRIDTTSRTWEYV